MGNTHIAAEIDTFNGADNTCSRNVDSRSSDEGYRAFHNGSSYESSYEINCGDESESSQETDEGSYEESNPDHQNSRHIIQICDPLERRAELEKKIAAINRVILNPLREEIALIEKTKSDNRPELEVILGETNADTFQQECTIKTSSFIDPKRVTRNLMKEPPRLHYMLVDPSLHHQVADELYYMRKSLEQRADWKFSYAYHLERFRQLHSVIVKDYQMKLEDLEIHRCKIEMYVNSLKKNNDSIRQSMGEASSRIVDLEYKNLELQKEAEITAKTNREYCEKVRITNQANTLKFQRKLKTAHNKYKELDELHELQKITNIEKLSEIASLRDQIARLNRRVQVDESHNIAFSEMIQAQAEECTALSEIQSEEIEQLRVDKHLLKEEVKALEFDLQSQKWASRLKEDLSKAEMLSTQYKFRKEVIEKLSGNFALQSANRVEAKKNVKEQLQQIPVSYPKDDPKDDPKDESKMTQKNIQARDLKFTRTEMPNSVNQVEKLTIDVVSPKFFIHKEEERDKRESHMRNHDVVFWDDAQDKGSACVKNSNTSFDSSFSERDSIISPQHFETKRSSSSDENDLDANNECESDANPATTFIEANDSVVEVSDVSSLIIKINLSPMKTDMNSAKCIDDVEAIDKDIGNPVVMNRRHMLELPAHSEIASTASTCSDEGIEVAAIEYLWDGVKKHMPVILPPMIELENRINGDEEQFYVSSVEATESGNDITTNMSLSFSEDISKKSIESVALEKAYTGNTDDLTRSPNSPYTDDEIPTRTSVGLKTLLEAYSKKANFFTDPSLFDESTNVSSCATEDSVEITRFTYENELVTREFCNGESYDEESETDLHSFKQDAQEGITQVDGMNFFKPGMRDDDSFFDDRDDKGSERETFNLSLRNENSFEFSYSPIEFDDNGNMLVQKDQKSKVPDFYEL